VRPVDRLADRLPRHPWHPEVQEDGPDLRGMLAEEGQGLRPGRAMKT